MRKFLSILLFSLCCLSNGYAQETVFVVQKNGINLTYSYEFEKTTGINNTDYQYKIVLYIQNLLEDKLSLSFDLDIGTSYITDFKETKLVLNAKDVLTRTKSISFANQGANVTKPNLKNMVVENLTKIEKEKAEKENRLNQAAENERRLKQEEETARQRKEQEDKATQKEKEANSARILFVSNVDAFLKIDGENIVELKKNEPYKAFVTPGDILVEIIPLAGNQYAKSETITTPQAKQQVIKKYSFDDKVVELSEKSSQRNQYPEMVFSIINLQDDMVESEKAIKYMIEDGLSVHTYNKSGRNILEELIINSKNDNKLSIIKYVIDKGAFPNSYYFSRGVGDKLMPYDLWLAKFNNFETLKYLLEKDKFLNRHTYSILGAADANNFPMVKYLTKDTKSLITDEAHLDTYDFVDLRKCSLEIVKHIVEEGLIGDDIFKFSFSDEVNVYLGQMNNSLITWAASTGNLELIKKLVKNGLPPYLLKDSPLKMAKKNKQTAVLEYIKSL